MPVDPRRWWALAAIVLTAVTLGFDITIMNVALPTIASALDVGTSGLQWMVNAYVLVLAGLMLTCGALGDRWGRRKLLLVGLGLFGAASVAATWADTAAIVIAARAVMGVGGAIILPVAFAVLPALFPPHERGKAVAVTVAATGVGIPLGPLIGGWLLDHFWWGSIFLINIPMAAVAMLAIVVLLPETRDPHPPRPDALGAVLSTAGLVALVYGFIEAPGRGWSAPVVVVALTAAVVLLAGFVWWQLRTDQPMIDLRLFGLRQFLWGSVAGMLVTFGLLGMLFVVPQYLQLVKGFDPFGTGLRLLPMIAGLVIGASAGERIAARAGYRIPITAGLLILAAGLAAGATTDLDSGYGFVAAWLAAVGLGIGMALSPAMDAILAALPPQRSGSGTAVTMTLRQVGGALGIALLGSVLSQGYTARLDTTGLPTAAAKAAGESLAAALAVAARLDNPALAADAKAAYLHGMTLVLVVCAVIALLSAVAIAVLMPGRRPSAGLTPSPERKVPA
ncbi:MFS transporter [Micromonospora aurantiaca]|uniref:MFS transporter n=1 Tax=Micromonospora aurantiaca (nom. illeg.) TaxID=47850 RepID=A0A6N3K914_9ACTN|nr:MULTISPECIES: MFS transporter [Micromonospora]ADU09697.1 drug resistance transporter, EmrB/QacA subfamily [Micromonospora sp. L5]AXH93676.1 MFS transporter [Micromonospora aurantiaca]KAB1108442.1 MFS transporter [Micromonospora aurantiaca]MBC9004359.1 MFS transporter [Micromonospora aurantiaca]MDG4752855.1 MFS transporter [Micromonospora sp. WMMD718]